MYDEPQSDYTIPITPILVVNKQQFDVNSNKRSTQHPQSVNNLID